MAISDLPTPPSRSDAANFAVRADAFLAALPTFSAEASALQIDVNAKQVAAANSEAVATTKAEASTAQANAAALSKTGAEAARDVAVIARTASEAARDISTTKASESANSAEQAAGYAASINPASLMKNDSSSISAIAGGTANAITASFTPAITTLTDGLTVRVRATAANTTTAPTLAADATGAKTIVKGNNLPLVAGDIAGAGHWLELQYDSTLDKYVLQNPATGIAPSAASETVSGIAKVATQALTDAGTNDLTIVTPKKLASLLIATSLGRGQTWQDVGISRAWGTTYTNSTGRPIAVAYRGLGSAGGSIVTGTIGGIDVVYTPLGATSIGSIFFIVPEGGTYSIAQSSGSMNKWSELR